MVFYDKIISYQQMLHSTNVLDIIDAFFLVASIIVVVVVVTVVVSSGTYHNVLGQFYIWSFKFYPFQILTSRLSKVSPLSYVCVYAKVSRVV